MSDTWLVVFPADPGWVPSNEQAAAAAKVIAELIPTEVADQPDLRLTPNIEFIDAGSNFGALRCPACGQDLELSWWHEQMDRQYRRDTGFHLQPVTVPCCARTTTLNDLAYGWPLGFARWQATTLSPDRGWLTDAELSEIGQALGHPVRQTARHI
ncbi:hypothetical protein GBP94_22010 [Mycobacterium avium subsp. hominissuis]|uniref:hypothetical protein n=1 Tax=Mycobacterium avium TaxID=1764 RepID=UPI001CC7A562|nr:hypothetical protein [Mycobacterium avium]MBZ4632045.1 hypothetical protein [Mycobacterium avium subsp. hominissuis]